MLKQPRGRFGAVLTLWSPDDILRARLKTVGVTEFRFEINKSELLGKFGPGASLSSGWHVYDVGGHRSMVRPVIFLLIGTLIYERFLRLARCGPTVPERSYPQPLICFFLITTAAWIPFFDDMNAIIFLAPISCFDQVLAEDPNVNRLVSVSLCLVWPPCTL